MPRELMHGMQSGSLLYQRLLWNAHGESKAMKWSKQKDFVTDEYKMLILEKRKREGHAW